MGLFEDMIRDGMTDPEFRKGWVEAEQELAPYASASMIEITNSSSNGSIALSVSQSRAFVSARYTSDQEELSTGGVRPQVELETTLTFGLTA